MSSVIYRAPKDRQHPYTAVSNDIIDNNQLSAEARLILIKMLRNQDGYSYSVNSISRSTGISIGKTTRAIKELQDAGYLKISRSKTTGAGSGRGFLITYEIHEIPVSACVTASTEDTAESEATPVTEIITPEQFKFEQFWEKYPKKVDYDKARKAFLSLTDINTVFPQIMDALEVQIKSKQWTEAQGMYIPAPANYLKRQWWNSVVDTTGSEEEAFQYLEDLVNEAQYRNV